MDVVCSDNPSLETPPEPHYVLCRKQEIVDGITVRDIILNDRTYWNENEDIIKNTIYLLLQTKLVLQKKNSY